MLHTALCDRLQIEFPIFAAPMGFVSGPELTAAVCAAGGMGIMSFSANPPALLRREIKCLASLTDKPFGVNVFLEGSRLPFSIESIIETCIDQRVAVLSTSRGDPAPYVEAAHAADIAIMHQVSTVAEAERAATAGVDIIVAQGGEAGGHVAGDIGTIAFVPRVVDAVAPVPVVAAGGIADARGVAAALALGAQGVMIGTRFIATVEAYAHWVYKHKILAADTGDTVRTSVSGDNRRDASYRTLRTPPVARWLAQTTQGHDECEDDVLIGASVIGGAPTPIVRFAGIPPTPDAQGDIESMDFLAGQGVGLAQDIAPAAAVVHELVSGATQVIERLSGYRNRSQRLALHARGEPRDTRMPETLR